MERSIYEFPEIFRRVHLERPGDIAKEVEFLKQVWGRHLSKPVRRVLDVACGDSPHGELLAQEGIATVGIDRSATMIAAGKKAQKVKFYRREIERFRIPERGFDAAIFMSETFPVIRSNQNIIYHFNSVGRVLRPGGLYCIDIDRHDGIAIVKRRKLWRERKVRVGRSVVEVQEFYRPIRWDEAMHSIYELECTIHFPEKKVMTCDIIPVRYWTPPQLELAAQASGRFEMIAAYADLSMERSMGRCYGRWMGVLRRV
jgi:SAM-dependent methyltransferase